MQSIDFRIWHPDGAAYPDRADIAPLDCQVSRTEAEPQRFRRLPDGQESRFDLRDLLHRIPLNQFAIEP